MLRAVRAYVHIESSEPLTVFSGKLVKTLVYAVCKDVRVFRGLRGVISPIHVSPLFKPGSREYELGDLVTPEYARKNGEYELKPVEVSGEYVVHLGGDAGLVDKIAGNLLALREPFRVKFGDSIVEFKLEDLRDVTKDIASKELAGDRLTLYLKGPAKPFNVYTKSRLPKFSVSALELLMAAYMLYRGAYTLTSREVVEAMNVLGLLVETYYSLNTVRPILVPLEGKEPGMIGKVTYIVDTKSDDTKRQIAAILNTAEIAGIGESRTNGFGTVAWKQKPA